MGVCSQSIRFFHCFLKENKYALPEQRWMLPEHTGMLLEHMLVGGCCWSIGGMLSEHWLPPITPIFSVFIPTVMKLMSSTPCQGWEDKTNYDFLKVHSVNGSTHVLDEKFNQKMEGMTLPKSKQELDIMIDYFNHFLNGGISQTLGVYNHTYSFIPITHTHPHTIIYVYIPPTPLFILSCPFRREDITDYVRSPLHVRFIYSYIEKKEDTGRERHALSAEVSSTSPSGHDLNMYGEIGWHFFVLFFIEPLFMMLCWCRLLFFCWWCAPTPKKYLFWLEKPFRTIWHKKNLWDFPHNLT